MSKEYILVKKSQPISGTINLSGAKNSCLVIIASLILTSGKSKLYNVPMLEDVFNMIKLLEYLGAFINLDKINNSLEVDTSNLEKFQGNSEIMNKMRTSVLVAGPLLARFKNAHLYMPGGCVIGSRPIDLHLKSFVKMGANIKAESDSLNISGKLSPAKIVLDYPSVGATENILMAAALTEGETEIINAALEPEVFDLVNILKKMGAQISLEVPATIKITGVKELKPVEYNIMPDRLEAGSLLLASAITGGELYVPDIKASYLDNVLEKLIEMGHTIGIGPNGYGIMLRSTSNPKAVSFKTMPYPGFPTDLQAPMMAALAVAEGTSIITETVFENRLQHACELNKLGANIKIENNNAIVTGVKKLYGAEVISTDIRAASCLVIAGLKAENETKVFGTHHLYRGYENLDMKLNKLGANVLITTD